jgi:hypothetical protein
MRSQYCALLLAGVLLAAASMGYAANVEHHMYWGVEAKDQIWAEFDPGEKRDTGAVEKPGFERHQTATVEAVAGLSPSSRQKPPIKRVSAATAGRSRGFPASAFARRLRLMTAAVR